MLDLSRSSGTGIVPCLPCCNFGYQSCLCATNERLNIIGGKNQLGQDLDKKNPSNLVTFFVKDLFAGESSVANRYDRTDAINQDGMMAVSVYCENKLWTFSFASTPRTLTAFVRFYEDKFEGKLIIDGVDSGWVLLIKSFGNEYLTTLEGEISGYQIISHSACVCRGDGGNQSYFYTPYMKETEIGIKPLFVVFNNVPTVCGSSFTINNPYTNYPYPIRTAEDLADYHANFPVTGAGSVRYNSDWHLNYKLVFQSGISTVFCNGKFLYMSFSWITDQYIVPLDYTDYLHYGNKEAATFTALTTTPSGKPAGTSNWVEGLLLEPKPSVYIETIPDFSFPIKLDLEPFFYDFTGYGYDRTQDDYALFIKRNHSVYDGEIFSPRVTITE